MTEAQFVKNHRGVDQGLDPPKALLEGMYRRVKVSPPTAIVLEFTLSLLACSCAFSWPTTRMYFTINVVLCVLCCSRCVLSLPPTFRCCRGVG